MSTKLIMTWNVRQETESEYYEFLVNEFIPGLTRLGIDNISVWYTAYGDCEQKLASGLTQSMAEMNQVMNSNVWSDLIETLEEYVNDFDHKVIEGSRGFQL